MPCSPVIFWFPLSKKTLYNLPKRDESGLRGMLALPNPSRMGVVDSIWSVMVSCSGGASGSPPTKARKSSIFLVCTNKQVRPCPGCIHAILAVTMHGFAG